MTRLHRLKALHAHLSVNLAMGVLLLSMLAGCMGWAPGRQAYWDARVKELCDRDGGVTVHERVYLTREEFKKLGGRERAVPLPAESAAPQEHPYVRRVIDTKLNLSNPEVVRSETQIIRRSDDKILGRSVVYWRRGGDLPTGIAHESSFICPERSELTPEVFSVGEEGK